MKKIFIILVALGSIYNIVYAYDFSAPAQMGTASQTTLYYKIKTTSTVELVGPGGENINTWNGYTKPSSSVVIPSTVTYAGQVYTVTSIAKYAFSNCTGLYGITIPSSIKTIGDRAFYDCSWLHVINLPSTALMMGREVLHGTHWYDSQASGVLLYLGNPYNTLTLIGYKGTLPNNSVVLSSNVKSIAGGAFEGSNISGISLPNTLEYIGPHAFYNCNNLYLEALPDSLKGIGQAAFYGCHWGAFVFELTIPSGMTEIMDSTFEYCTGLLTSVIIPNSITKIRRNAFWGMEMTSVTIGENVDSMMIQCMPWNTIQTVNYNAVNCKTANLGGQPIFASSSLSTFNIGTNVQTLPDFLISSCGNLHSVSFPNSIVSIGKRNFWYCGLSGTLSLPSSLEQIGANAFADCTGLTSIQCNVNTPPVVFGGSSIFSNCYNIPLLVPCSSISSYQNATGWGNFTSISGISGCNYTVTLSVNNSSMGSVSGGGTYPQGATVTISATANSGYHFDHWSDGNTQNPRSITVTGNISLTAYFEANPITQYTITVNSNNATMGSASGGGTFNGGTTTTITATANNGYHFTHWQDGNTSNPRTITVTSNATYTAYFEANPPTQYTIIVNSNNATMGSASGGGTFNGGTTTTITATANSGYHFTHWQDGNTSNPRTITVTSNATYTAYFAPTQYTITVNSNNTTMGSVNGGGTFNGGTTTTITATANNGYHFTHWQDGNTSNPRTITVTSNATYTAYFEANPPTQYTITVNSNNATMGSASGGGTFNGGTTTTITATANNGYHFTQWQDGNTSNPRTITVMSNATYTAYFAPTRYTITVNSNNTTMGSASGGGTFNEGTTTTITATANGGYHFTQWQDGNTSNPRTITVTSNATYTAYFAPIQYTITVNSNNTAMGSVGGGGTFSGGSVTTITATANDGHHFTQWQDGNTSNPRTIMVTCDATYTAYFAPTQYTITVNSNNTTMGSVSGGGTFNEGTTTTISATANNGYHFTQWQDGNTSNPRTITVTGSAAYTAYFEADLPAQYTIIVTSANTAMGTVSGGGTYYDGTTINISAIPNSGYRFVRWNDNNTDNPRTVTVTADMSFTAYFESDGTQGIDDVGVMGYRLCVVDGRIHVTSDGQPVDEFRVYDVVGREVYRANHASETPALPGGVYLVKVGTLPARKVVVIK